MSLELTVGAVAHGGHCVARHEGRVVFVRHALPGERVRAEVTEDHGSYLRADAVEVLAASPDRVEPPCPYAGPGRCGGCDWQHATPAAQRALKEAVVREQLARLAGLPDVDVRVEELPGGPLGWRTRVRYTVAQDGVVGLRRHRSHEVEAIERCRIATPEVSAVGVQRQRWPDTAALEVVASSHGDVAVSRTDTRGRSRRLQGRRTVRERTLGRLFRVGAAGFWQVHPAAPDTLARAVVDGLDPAPGESALDLYSGVGLFAAALAPSLGPTGRLTLIEADRAACGDAGYNLRDAAPQVRVEPGRVDRLLDRLGVAADLVVLDPPRAGAGARVVHQIAALRPRAVAYVACDPAALARDLKTFAGAGYALDRLHAYDLFPMTAHVECVAILRPSDGGMPATGSTGP